MGCRDIEEEYFVELWKEEELAPDEKIDRARLLVMFSEEYGLGELAGADAVSADLDLNLNRSGTI